MDRLDAMAMVVAAVDEGSLAAAARRYGRSAAAATRAVALMETLAGETLLLRSTRRLSLTAAGERQVVIWRDVLAKLAEGKQDAVQGPISGTIVITAPELFGRLKVMPIVETFLERHPKSAARVLMLNRMVDLVGEGIDLAVRLAPLPDSSLTAVKLGDVRRLLCASPAYLARAGGPDTPNDLGRHDCIGTNGDGDRELWAFALPDGDRGRIRSVGVGTRLALNSAGAAIDAALRGHGIVRPMSYQVAEHLAAGRLVRLLADFEPPPTPVHFVFHAEPSKRGALRAFIDHAVPRLRSELTRIGDTLAASGAVWRDSGSEIVKKVAIAFANAV
jgi:DNA-binding transcriptional LysR family regulator